MQEMHHSNTPLLRLHGGSFFVFGFCCALAQLKIGTTGIKSTPRFYFLASGTVEEARRDARLRPLEYSWPTRLIKNRLPRLVQTFFVGSNCRNCRKCRATRNAKRAQEFPHDNS